MARLIELKARNYKTSQDLWRKLEQDGLALTRAPDAFAEAEEDAALFIQNLLGKKPLRVLKTHVKPQARADNWTRSKEAASFHTDLNSYLPAHLQILICKRPAAAGGHTVFRDSWDLLSRVRKNDPKLFRSIYRTPCSFAQSPDILSFLGPQFSYRMGGLLTTMATLGKSASPNDPALALWWEKVDTFTSRVEAGELVINNNHRYVHARTAFRDSRRHLLRLLVWFDAPLPAPKELVRPALSHFKTVEKKIRKEPRWIQERLGLFGPRELRRILDHEEFDLAPDHRSPRRAARLCRAYARANPGAPGNPFAIPPMPPNCGSG